MCRTGRASPLRTCRHMPLARLVRRPLKRTCSSSPRRQSTSSRALPACAPVRHSVTVKPSVDRWQVPDTFGLVSHNGERLRPRAEVRARRLVRPPCLRANGSSSARGPRRAVQRAGARSYLPRPGPEQTGLDHCPMHVVTVKPRHPAGTRLRPSTMGRTASTVCSRRSRARDPAGSSTFDRRPPRCAVGGLGETRFRRDLGSSGTDVLVMGLPSKR